MSNSQEENLYPIESTLELDPQEEAIPFVQIPNALIRDDLISPNCRWLLCYLLSNNEKVWVIKIQQILDHVTGFMGKSQFYKILDEAIDSGYIRRETFYVRNLRRCKYYVSRTPRFKKLILSSENMDVCIVDVQNSDHKEELSRRILSLRRQSNKSSSSQLRHLPKQLFDYYVKWHPEKIGLPPNPLKSIAPKKKLEPPENEPIPAKKEPEPSEESLIPEEISLRSEEEDFSLKKELDKTMLSPKEKVRVSKEFTSQEIIIALKKCETIPIKQSFARLLFHVLRNPDKYPDTNESQYVTQEKSLALQYNEELNILAEKSKVDAYKKLYEENKKLIESNVIKIPEGNNHLIQLSLKAYDFKQEIKMHLQKIRTINDNQK